MTGSDDLQILLQRSLELALFGRLRETIATSSPAPPPAIAAAAGVNSGEVALRRASALTLRELEYIEERYEIELLHFRGRFTRANRARSRQTKERRREWRATA